MEFLENGTIDFRHRVYPFQFSKNYWFYQPFSAYYFWFTLFIDFSVWISMDYVGRFCFHKHLAFYVATKCQISVVIQIKAKRNQSGYLSKIVSVKVIFTG